jgi:predicted GNAT family acetyltransferase
LIRKLNDKDHNNLMDLVILEPEFNLYIIGDIENFGYNQNFLELFGEFDENNNLSAVLVRYFSVYMIYAKSKFDLEGFVDVIKKCDNLETLVGKTEIVSQFKNTSLEFHNSELHHFAVLKEINPSFEIDSKIIVKKADIKDVDGIINLKSRIKEFSKGSNKFKEILLNDLKAGTAHGYYIEIDGNIVSYAQTSAENSKSAMVVSVMTDENYRRRGLASVCIKELCNDMIRKQRTLCLFYKNPEAGEIYKRIGFKEIGMWSMYMKANS